MVPAGRLSSVLKIKFYDKILCNIFLFSKHYFSPLNMVPLWEKGRTRIQKRIRIHTSNYWIRIREAQKHADPDTQHR
jgi:hypothetical protein